jgi:hypothetical protein
MRANPPAAPPPALERVMDEALGAAEAGDPRAALAAAETCLGRALERIDERAIAIDLLAADALLTEACARAAGAGGVGALAAEATARLTALVERETDR